MPRIVSDVGQFSIIPAWILNHPTLSNRAKVLFGIMLLHQRGGGSCEPSRRELARRVGLSSARNLGRLQDQLVAVGALAIERRPIHGGRHRTNVYTLRLVQPGEQPPPSKPSPEPITRRSGFAEKGGLGGLVPCNDPDQPEGSELYEVQDLRTCDPGITHPGGSFDPPPGGSQDHPPPPTFAKPFPESLPPPKRLTRAERHAAEQRRESWFRAFGTSCRHVPNCSSVEACQVRIALESRDREAAALEAARSRSNAATRYEPDGPGSGVRH